MSGIYRVTLQVDVEVVNALHEMKAEARLAGKRFETIDQIGARLLRQQLIDIGKIVIEKKPAKK